PAGAAPPAAGAGYGPPPAARAAVPDGEPPGGRPQRPIRRGARGGAHGRPFLRDGPRHRLLRDRGQRALPRPLPLFDAALGLHRGRRRQHRDRRRLRRRAAARRLHPADVGHGGDAPPLDRPLPARADRGRDGRARVRAARLVPRALDPDRPRVLGRGHAALRRAPGQAALRPRGHGRGGGADRGLVRGPFLRGPVRRPEPAVGVGGGEGRIAPAPRPHPASAPLRERPSRARAIVGRPKPTGVGTLLANRYPLLLFSLSFFGVLAKYFVDFAFLAGMKAHWSDPTALASFFGLFSGVTQMLSLLMRVFVSAPL